MNAVLEKIEKIGIVPVVVLNDAKDAEPLAKALIAGGLPCAEVTFRTAAAEEPIKKMSTAFPEMLVGAGTEVEVMKRGGRGKNGHIAIGTNSVIRAKNYLETVKGVKFDEDSLVIKEGKVRAIYLEQPIGGFDVHLVQKQNELESFTSCN